SGANDGSRQALLQADLVLNPAELSALPFEIGKDGTGEWLFRASPPVVITRRVRGIRKSLCRWLPGPKVLFVWASPPDAGPPVPHLEHLRALTDALMPWIEPLEGSAEVS